MEDSLALDDIETLRVQYGMWNWDIFFFSIMCLPLFLVQAIGVIVVAWTESSAPFLRLKVNSGRQDCLYNTRDVRKVLQSRHKPPPCAAEYLPVD